MANKIEQFDFPPPKPHPFTEKYPWDEWCDGSTYEILEGVDYQTKSIRTLLQAQAKKRGLDLKFCQMEKGIVRFKFVKPATPPTA